MIPVYRDTRQRELLHRQHYKATACPDRQYEKAAMLRLGKDMGRNSGRLPATTLTWERTKLPRQAIHLLNKRRR